MSVTLSFVDRLFERALELEKRGLTASACRELRRLLHIRPLTRKMVGQAAGRLGNLELERGQFAKARRHLSLAVSRLPRDAELQNLLARAIEADETCAIDHAERPLQMCTRLEPKNPRYLIDLARFGAARGKTEDAADLLRRAFELGGDDPSVVAGVAEGLRDLGEMEEAQRLLRTAQFRHGRDPRFRQLWNDHQFQVLWARQQAARPSSAEEIPILHFARQPVKQRLAK